MKRIFTLLFMCLILITACFAQEISYTEVDETTLFLNISSYFELIYEKGSSSVSSTNVNLELYPMTDYRQELLYLKTDGNEQNNMISYEFKNPDEGIYPFGYTAKIRVKNEFRAISKKINFPLEEGYEYVDEYTSPTDYIDFDDSVDIAITADKIVAGEEDMYVAVYKLARWITENIEYNLSTADTVEKASRTLEVRRGVCDEATILFIAFARHLGIPTKYVSGLAYTNLEGINDWGPHAWAEVYFKDYGWIPFDFTYQQYGFVDASHIKLKESLDANEASVKYEWVGRDTKLVTSPLNMKTTQLEVTGEKENPISIDLEVAHQEIGEKSHNLIIATIKNLKNNYFTTDVHLSKAPEIVGNNNQIILLKPLEEKKVFWIVSTDATLENDFQYLIYTVEANSLHVSDAGNFTLRKKELSYSKEDIQNEIDMIEKEEDNDVNKQIEFSCSNKNTFYDYEPTQITCSVKNIGSTNHNLKLCLLEECESFSLSKNQQKNIDFTYYITEVQKYAPRATLTNTDIYKTIPIEFEIIQKPDVITSITSKPNAVDFDDIYSIKFRIDKIETPRKVNIFFKLSDYQKNWSVDSLNSPREYTLKLKADNIKSGNNTFWINTTYYDDNDIQYKVAYNDKIVVRDMNFFQILKYYLVKFISKIEHSLEK